MSLFVAIMSLTFIIPAMGMFIDIGLMYVVKTRLQASVDGASLAAARALTLGATTEAQAASAKQNAINWFYANFPPGNWATANTVMDQSSINVFEDPNNPLVRNVTVTARTIAPTYFMKWLNFNNVTVAATGNASRRDVVVMMVLDRSGSMGSVCSDMITAAKLFTGQFAAGRDRIGLVSFSDNVYIHSSPTTNFRSVLGYQNGSGSGNGAIDTITCKGGTATAQAISVGYNELYRMNLPGALNILMFETDGLPNTLTLNFWDSAASVAGISNGSACKDKNNKTKANGGFNNLASLRNWTTGWTLPSGSYFNNIPAGIVGSVYSSDPGQGAGSFLLMMKYLAPSTANNFNSTDYLDTNEASGCTFVSSHGTTDDLAWFPRTDVWGNDLKPASNPYQANVTLSNNRVANSGTTAQRWTNFHNAALNATDDAAYRARTNTTIPAYFFGIGLGGNGDVDFALLQRMSNDPTGDSLGDSYEPCAQTPGCLTYADQPHGTFIYSPTRTQLNQAFLSISSQILRLSR